MKIRGNTVGTTLNPEASLLLSTGLTEEQKAQARANIGASAVGEGGNGESGVSPTVDIAEIDGGHRVTFTDANGPKQFDVLDGQDGPIGPQGPQGATGPQGPKGDTGAQGPKGDTGATGGQGPKGDTGSPGYTPQKGVDYNDGVPGDNGATFIPAVSPEGVISWSNDRGLENPEPVDIKGPQGAAGPQGPKGDTGATGPQGEPGNNGVTYTPYVSEGGELIWTNNGGLPNPPSTYVKGGKGATGDRGEQGQRGAGLLSVFTVPYAYTAEVDGIKVTSRMEISDIKEQAGVTEVLPGDTVQSGYYLYPIVCLDASYAYFATRVSIRGETGKDGSTPVKGVDYFTEADKAEMVEAVLESMDGIPSYWQTALDDGVEAINTALCEAGRNKSAFLFYTDAHWNYGSQMSPTLLKYLYKHTGMTRTFFGGDIVNNEADDYDTMKYLWEWRKQLKDLPNHHSVVGNHDDGNTTNNLFSEQYVYGYLLSAEESSDMVMGEGIYYYVDSPAEKTRYLCLDTAYRGVDSKQQEFVKNALLTTPGGWHIVAISHIWHDTNYNVTPPVPGTINSGASTLLSMFEAYNSRNGDYADCTGWVEFCIGGHTHWDYDSTSALGIPIILVETDSQHIRSGLTFTAGTTTEASVNGIVADYDAKTVKVVRIGRGASREVEMTWYEVSYTNVIPTATDTDGVTIYNGIGYKGNTRMSGTSGAFRDNEGSCCTGYIKIPESGSVVVRMKNIVNNTANNYGCNFYFFNGTGVAATDSVGYGTENLTKYYSPVYDENGNVVEITTTNEGEWTHMVISAVTIDATSVITINEPIE